MDRDWAEDFSRFLADMGPCPEGHTLGRIDVDQGYGPDNCRWETAHQQARARTDNVWVTLSGERLVLKDYAERVGVPYKRIHTKIRYEGLTIDEAVKALT
jgi:hypothetical protein